MELKPNRKPGRPVKPLSREKYGKLTPVRYVINSRWLCICDCGKENVSVSRSNLESGRSTHCGCGAFTNSLIEGKLLFRCNFFVVIGWAPPLGIAVCDCGREFKFRKTSMNSTLSCGCIKEGMSFIKSLGIRKSSHPLYALWTRLKVRSAQESIPMDLDWKFDFVWFWGWALSQTNYSTNSIRCINLHRRDQTKGFFPENCDLSTSSRVRGARPRS